MGRGRAKAKQAKVARQLKYAGASTDLDALRRELVTESSVSSVADSSVVDTANGDVEVDDEFDDFDDGYDDEDEPDEGRSRG